MSARFLSSCLGVMMLATLPVVAGDYWVPAAAHADGAQGSVWRTDLVIANVGDAPADLSLALLVQGADNTSPTTANLGALPAGATLRLEDVCAATFGFTGTAALRVASSTDDLIVTSRTFNLGASGSFGQSIRGIATAAALPAGVEAVLPGISGTDGRRSNVGWVSLEDRPVTVTLRLLDAGGAEVAATTYTEPAYGQRQVSLFQALGSAPLAAGTVRIVADGRLQPYASVVAAGSNDPIFIPALTALDAATDLLLPAAARVDGAGGTRWTSDAWIVNLGSGPARVEAELWRQGQPNPSPTRVTVTAGLASGAQLELSDLVMTAFGLDGVQGAVRFLADQPVLVTSRAFNTAASGTFGQFIPARAVSGLAGVGETLVLPGATQSADFRANLGLVTTAPGSTVELTLRGSDGAVLATASRALGQGQQIQERASSLFGVSQFANATIEVTLAAAADGADGGRFAAYLSTVDNSSTDPTFAPATSTLAIPADADELARTITVAAYGLNRAVESSAPQAFKSLPSCLVVDYDGDTLRPGESPVGKCWQVDVTFDDCAYELPNAGWAFSQTGGAAVDVCILDDFVNTLTADLETTLIELATGQEWFYGLEADLSLAMSFEGSRPESARLWGEASAVTTYADVDLWIDLKWDHALTSFEFFPTGTLKAVFPYNGALTSTGEALATFDGTEWVLVQVRAGAWVASFMVNLLTGEVVWI